MLEVIKKTWPPYDYKALVDAYVISQCSDFVHKDFKTYYTGLVSVLAPQFGVSIQTTQFGVHFNPKEFSFDQRAFWMLFGPTVESLIRLTTPFGGFQEASLIYHKLENGGDIGKAVLAASERIYNLYRESESLHREMLYGLFTMIYGNHPEVFTSEDLLRLGFDDTQEPDTINYDV